jgi:hypothetical protein
MNKIYYIGDVRHTRFHFIKNRSNNYIKFKMNVFYDHFNKVIKCL